MMKRADGSLLASKDGTIYHSDYSGVDWGVLAKPQFIISHMVSMAMATNEVLVAAGKEIDTTWIGGSIRWFYKFYYSSDGGHTWHNAAIEPERQIPTSPCTNPASPLCVCGGYVFMKNSSGLFRARDPAGACQKLSTPIPPDSIICLASGASGTVYCGTRGRIFLSLTKGNDWIETVFSDTSLAVYSLCEVSADTLVLGTNDGIYRMAKENAALTRVQSLSTLIVLDVKSASPGVLYAATGNGLFRSTDNGATWFQAGVVAHVGVQCLAVGKNGTLYAGVTRGVYRSEDFGSTWSLLMRGLPNSCCRQCSPLFDSTHQIISLRADESGVLYLGTYFHGLFTSSDHGATWTSSWAPKVTGHAYETIADSRQDLFLATWPEGVLKYVDYSPVIRSYASPDRYRKTLNYSGRNSAMFDMRGKKIGFYDPAMSRTPRLGTGIYILKNGNTVRKMVQEIDR